MFPRGATWGWRGVGIAATLFAIVSLSLVFILKSPSAEELLSQEIVSSHVRSLMADHLTDVPSTDQHTVKPWFNGKVDFSPQVTDLTQQGFTLVGGRLDYVENKPVVALVYLRRKHFINLFTWLSSVDAHDAGKTWTRQGYNLIHWTKSSMTYWAVSDITPTELEEFAHAIQNPS
jgi:anti-sigma factor RsiW